MLLAGVFHLAGELLFVAASWGLSVPLMPPDATGEYQGVFSTGEAITLMLAPAVMTTLVGSWGRPGWLVLAGAVPRRRRPRRFRRRAGRCAPAGCRSPPRPRESAAARG